MTYRFFWNEKTKYIAAFCAVSLHDQIPIDKSRLSATPPVQLPERVFVFIVGLATCRWV